MIERNTYVFDELPMQLKNEYDSKSDNIMAVCIFEECYDILFNFVDHKIFTVCTEQKCLLLTLHSIASCVMLYKIYVDNKLHTRWIYILLDMT